MSAGEFSAARWFISSRSNGQNNCVEAAFLAEGQMACRESKDTTGPVLRFAAGQWAAFIDGVKADRFDAA